MNILEFYQQTYTYDTARFNHSADSIALVFINIVLCGVTLVCFGKLVKGVINTVLSHEFTRALLPSLHL
jgi:hypothetical protein